MAYSLLKIYKHGAFLVSSNKNVFSPPSPSYSLHYNDLRNWQEAKNRCDRLLNSFDVDKIDRMYLYVRNTEKMKRLNFNKLNSIAVNNKKQSFDFSDTSAESIRKAKSRIRDICLCNDFDYFCTFTFASELIDRYSQADIIPELTKFFKNYFRRNSGSYIFVAEKHKDGAFHFHGLLSTNNKDKSIVRSYNPHNGFPLFDKCGRPVYNLLSWGWGHSTLTPVGSDSSWAIKYILKYITKEYRCFPRFYYSGGFLVRKPALLYIHDENVFDSLLESGAYQFTCNSNNDDLKFCGLWLDDALDPLDDLGE